MHSYITDTYKHVETDKRCKWAINHNNCSGPNSPVHITLIEIDGERLKLGDDRIEEFKLPFGVLAEFVGMRVLRDKISELEQTPARHALGLDHQGGYCVMD